MSRLFLVALVLLALAAPGLAQDSLNCRQVGLWPELQGGDYLYSGRVALDPLRDLAFLPIWWNETLGNDRYLGVHILDVSDPAHPRRLASTRHDDGQVYYGLAYHGNRLYFGQGGRWEIWDVSNPEEPGRLARVDGIGASGLAADGDYLYVAHRQLFVFDVSDPRNPVEVGRCTTLLEANEVFVVEELAYVTDYFYGLRIIDVSDPTAPEVIGSCELAGYPFWIAVAGGYAYLTDVSYGDSTYWHIVDVSNPENPTLVVSVPEVRGTVGIAVSEEENLVYVGCGTSQRGMRIFDVSDPAEPVEVGYYSNPSFWPYEIALAGRLAFVIAGDRGLRVIEFLGTGVEEPPDERLQFSGRGPTVVRGSLSLPPSLSIHRSSLITSDGRLVMDLQPGENDVRHLAPGVYFVRAQGSRGQGVEGQSAKVVIQR
ncbi:MAG: hypothetical protein R6X14_00035 [bacterium]